MNPEIKAKWIDALLSGEYVQGRRFLRSSEDKYCCLGVLCDLYSKETGVEWIGGQGKANEMHGLSGMTPPEVDQWAGFTASGYYDPETNNDTYTLLSDLADLNDGGWTFKEIVEVIKEKL